MNRYIKDRAMRRSDRANGRTHRGGTYNISGSYDRRNPYGSAGGYVRDHENRSGAEHERYREHDYRGSDYNSGYYHSGDYHGGYGYNPYMMDYSRYDRKAEREAEHEYYEELDKWINKLKRKNKFNINESQVIDMAKRINLKMDDYDEKEFYATFLMMVSDYGKVSADPQAFIEMSKAFLEDDDTELKGSEKLCKYLYAIVLDDDE